MAEAFNRSSVALSGTTITDGYQAPNSNPGDRAVVLSVMVANKKTTGAVAITCTITDSANAAIAVLSSAISIPASATVELIPNKVILKNGEKIRLTAGEANQLEATVSVLEVTV